MSSPTPRDPQPDEEDKNPIDELDENAASENAQPGSSTDPLPKRGRGRPKGSKNKKGTAAAAAPAVPTVPRKRGRPPKEKKDTGEEPPPKRPRGRPPKNPKPPAGTSAEGADSTPPVKRKRGRPPKNPPPAPTPGS